MSDHIFSLADVERALCQYAQLRDYCQTPLLVPKLSEQLPFLPDEAAIAYSIDTTHGAARFDIGALATNSYCKFSSSQGSEASKIQRKIHLLGGSPHAQMRLRYKFETKYGGQVVSADCNMHQREAIKHAKYWQASRWLRLPYRTKRDQYLEYFRLSCRNIYRSWQIFETENGIGETQPELQSSHGSLSMR
jgi:hypothetical protein